MEDCNKLAPTKMVNQNQFSLTYIPNNTLNMMKVPAIALINLFIIILFILFKPNRFIINYFSPIFYVP